MGRLTSMRKRTLRGQIVSSFYLILVLSILATLITWGLIGLFFFLQKGEVNPANHYESQIPDLVDFIHEQGDILDHENKDMLEDVIPLEGIDYQVIDIDGRRLYGTISQQYIISKENLANNLNTNIYDGKQIIKYYPIFDEQQNMNGAIGFRYEISVISSNPKGSFILMIVFVFALFSPFLYFYLFSYLIGKRFSGRIEKPFNEIIKSAQKIQHHDLDFSLSHIKSTVELNQLVFAFEEMKEALKKSLQRQWELEQDRRDMVAAIAHDLKTPLTIILGHVEGLLEMKEHHPERTERYLLTIQSSCQRSIRLIKELNDVSLIEQVEFELNFSPVNLKEWINSKAKEYELLCKSKNIRFKAVIDKNNTDEVYIDLFRINQVLDNVITNSLNYTPVNSEIKWSTTITNRNIVFEIIDDGPGFSVENASKAFKKFYQGDTSRRSQTGHSGLGLFIAQTLTNKHEGEISVQNRAVGGAYVKVEIKNMKEGIL